MASQIGVIFKVSTFGESHGPAVGCVVDGCPAGVPLDTKVIQAELNRRRPGQNKFTTARNEPDTCKILSGVENGITLGTPIAIVVENKDARPADYSDSQSIFRPGHADYTYHVKFGVSARSGGGRASARETIGRVAAGAVAKQMLKKICGEKIAVHAWVQRIAHIDCGNVTRPLPTDSIESSDLRTPHPEAEAKMKEHLESLMQAGDTAGGLIRCVVEGVQTGWGEPVFDKLEAELAKAMLSLPASKSFEIGSGIAGTFRSGSEENDAFIQSDSGKTITRTNNSGGIQGGISNGMDIEFSVGFKPVSSIRQAQDSVSKDGKPQKLEIQKGRHDPCVLPRAVPIVEAMTWLTLADHALRAALNRVDSLAGFMTSNHQMQSPS
ncbi:MAG: chorismate synthase [Silvanigrellaceae bacterium]